MIGDDVSLLVETLWDRRLTCRMLEAIAPLTADAPIRTVVNTHSDGDHWWGNSEVTGGDWRWLDREAQQRLEAGRSITGTARDAR